MKPSRRVLTLVAASLAASLAAAPTANAAARRTGPLEVTGAWSRPAVAGLNGVGYMTLANHGPRPATLVKVESPAARKVEIHRSSMSHGVMSMGEAGRVEAPAGGTVSFAPWGYHLMFLGLKANLNPGDRLPATLVFADGRRIGATFQVRLEPPPVGHSDAAGRGGAGRSQLVTKK